MLEIARTCRTSEPQSLPAAPVAVLSAQVPCLACRPHGSVRRAGMCMARENGGKMDLFREPPHGADTPITPELAVGGVRSRCVLSGTGVSVLEAGTSQNCACLKADRPQTTVRLPGAAHAAHTRRLARGGSEAESASMSLNGGSSPSIFPAPVRGNDGRLAAKEHAAAKDKSADHRRVNAEMVAALAPCTVQTCANCLKPPGLSEGKPRGGPHNGRAAHGTGISRRHGLGMRGCGQGGHLAG